MSLTVTKILYTVDIVDGSGNTVTVSPITQSVDVASTGPQGATGPTVVSVAVGSTSTGTAGSSASVTNVGTSTSAILDFTIPRGDTGAAGSAATITAGSVTTLPAGSAATVTNTGSSSAATFAFGIPQGIKGDTGSTGTAATISVGTVTTLAAGSPATVTNTGSSSAAIFSFGIPQGAQGSAGPQGSAGATGATGTAATISVGTVTQGTAVSVTNVGTTSAAIFDFVLVKGDTGAQGSAGPQGTTGTAATITAGSVTTLAAGSPATVTNTGTSSAAIFSFGIPAGSAGATGATGAQGSAGASGVVTVNAPLTDSGTAGSANIAIGTAATGGVYGVTTLTDSTSSTSTTTAATPASVKSSYDLAAAAVAADNFHLAQGFTATTIETFARNANVPNSISWTSTGRVYFAIFTPVKNLTIGTASFYCTTTPTTTTTARMGLYTWDQATGTATLVARTANDATLFGTAAVVQSRAFDTTGGYPATYTLTAGSAYAFGMIFVGTGNPTVGALTITNTALSGLTPRLSGQRASQSDLSTIGSLTDTALRIWGRFS